MHVVEVGIAFEPSEADRLRVDYRVDATKWEAGAWVRDTVFISGPPLGSRTVTLTSEPWQIPTGPSNANVAIDRTTGEIQLPQPLQNGDLTAKVTVSPVGLDGAENRATKAIRP